MVELSSGIGLALQTYNIWHFLTKTTILASDKRTYLLILSKKKSIHNLGVQLALSQQGRQITYAYHITACIPGSD